MGCREILMTGVRRKPRTEAAISTLGCENARARGRAPLPDPEAFLDDRVFSVKTFQTTQLTQLNSAHGQEGGQAPAQAVSVLQVISLRFYSLLPDDILELPKDSARFQRRRLGSSLTIHFL